MAVLLALDVLDGDPCRRKLVLELVRVIRRVRRSVKRDATLEPLVLQPEILADWPAEPVVLCVLKQQFDRRHGRVVLREQFFGRVTGRRLLGWCS